MGPIELFLKLNGKFSFLRKITQNAVKKAVLNPSKRAKLNRFYHRMSYYEKSIFHSLYGRIFRDGKQYTIDGVWILKFAGKDIKIPLRSESLWLDWETAISVLGHDYEIKEYYEEKITSENPPSCFLDIGANYGTHSLMFLSCGIRAISIEPNLKCKPFFDTLCKVNGVQGEWHAIALGDKFEHAQITFPETELWLGSLSGGNIQALQRFERLNTQEVTVDTLDDFIKNESIRPDLVKLDTEGYEKKVICGGERFLKEQYPDLIFEAHGFQYQETMINTLNSIDYKVFGLYSKKQVVSLDSILPKETNFLAVNIDKDV
ncbi:FkbM family methyltransferase [Echinicola marina]|uniref:FkbM family methyltransferase n=1 Tax=Echinicola marina TaxID=2859768 RepID=UPI001CF70AD9|nr:FkbM family methyltransferase [Echinicola marina]UCS91980.1 FkbM family methyltransferase [Echinicola marina]